MNSLRFIRITGFSLLPEHARAECRQILETQNKME